MKMRFYQDGDLEAIGTTTVEPFMPTIEDADFKKVIKNNLTITTIDNDQVITVGGIIMTDENNGYFWLRVKKTDNFLYGMYMVEVIRAGKEIVEESLNIPNLYCYILDGFRKGIKLAVMFGFKKTDEYVIHNNIKYYKYRMN